MVSMKMTTKTGRMTTTTTTNSRWSRLLIALTLGVAAAWLAAPDAAAHAAYESSTPAFAEELSESPSEISIRFTQELFRREGANTLELARTTSSDLLDEYELGPVQIDNEDRKVMTAQVPNELPPGRYTVRWTNLSAEDGDEDSGWLPFYVQSEPEPWQVAEDRELAQELLITYPGDEADQPDVAETTAPPTPAVVRANDSDDASLGPGPIIWLAVGGLAALIVVGTLGFHLGNRRRTA